MSGSLKPATEQLIATLNKSNQDQGGQGGQGVNASHLVDVPKTLVSDDAPLQLHGGGAAPWPLKINCIVHVTYNKNGIKCHK